MGEYIRAQPARAELFAHLARGTGTLLTSAFFNCTLRIETLVE